MLRDISINLPDLVLVAVFISFTMFPQKHYEDKMENQTTLRDLTLLQFIGMWELQAFLLIILPITSVLTLLSS